jgi:curli biogenesis system outer membrane secretion channel CsgG
MEAAGRFCLSLYFGPVLAMLGGMKSILSLAALLAAVFTVAGQEKQAPTLFVAPLEGDTSQIMGWQPALGEGLAEMLITEVTRIGKFQVLESTALKDLADEIKLGDEGYVNEQERVEKGGWAGADFMLRGKVTRFGSKEQGAGLGGFVPGSLGKLGVKVTTSDVRIDWRLVDVFNRKVIKSGQATASQKGAGFDVGVAVDGHGGNIGFSNKEFMNSALGKATAKAVTNVVQELATANLPESGRLRSKAQAAGKQAAEVKAATDALKQTPGKVLAVVNKTTMIVSLGGKHGFKAGDKLGLYETVDTKDDQGNVVFSEEKLAGEVTLEAVQEERSKASYTSSSDAKTGWVVKAK